MKIDPRGVVAFTLFGGNWYHPLCAPPVDASNRELCPPGIGFDAYEYLCEGCGQRIDRVRPFDRCAVDVTNTPEQA